jgi:hypothetical protein
MAFFANRIRTRIVPALLTAAGVAFLAAGLMSFTSPVSADPAGSPTPAPSVDTGAVATPEPLITLPPLGSGGLPSTAPSFPPDRVATRIRIAALKIDLPVIKPGGATQHPLCDVAMYYQDPRLGQPGEGRVTYLYAHAQAGMFLPLLTASKISNGSRMIGMVVEVWTSDDQRFLFVITRVVRHVPVASAFDGPFAVRTEQLWLQTSEGIGPQPKLQIVAEPLSQEAAPHADAHPVPHPRVC